MSSSSPSIAQFTPPVRLGILVSGKGRGSNMQALIDATRSGRIPGEVVLVVSASADTPALERAAAAGIPTLELPRQQFASDEELDRALIEAFRNARVDLICLGGYMRLLGSEFVRAFPYRVLNIHPSLLPAFGGQGFYGKRVHQAVLETGAQYTGVTVHFVDEEYDRGPIILQQVVPVEDADSVETLAARVLEAEHRAYPEAVRRYAQGRLRLEGRRVRTLPEREGQTSG